jgi:hypothetical protein
LSAKETALIGAVANIAEAVELHPADLDNGMMRARKKLRTMTQLPRRPPLRWKQAPARLPMVIFLSPIKMAGGFGWVTSVRR